MFHVALPVAVMMTDCCFDKQNKGLEQNMDVNVSRFICTGSLITLNTEMRVHNNERYGMKYLVSGVCPDNNETSDVIRQCHESHITSFEDLIWVTDTSSGRIYKNKHCAECNGITSYSYWIMKTNCKYTFDARSVLYNDKCKFEMEPPPTNKASVGEYICEIPTITQCNVTGQWPEYNDTLYRACKSLTLPFRSFMAVYKNRYCYLCNKGDLDLRRAGQDECLDDYNTDPNGGLSYTTLLDLKRMEKNKQQKDVENRLRCRFDQIYDHYLVSSTLKHKIHYSNWGSRLLNVSKLIQSSPQILYCGLIDIICDVTKMYIMCTCRVMKEIFRSVFDHVN